MGIDQASGPQGGEDVRHALGGADDLLAQLGADADQVAPGRLRVAGAEHGAVAGLRDEVPVRAPHGGTVIEWPVHDGDPVSPGQPLVRLHPQGVTA